MTYKEIIYNSNLPALKVDINYPQKEILKELKNIPNKYFINQIGNKHWKGTALRGISYDKPRPCIEYGYNNENTVPYVWTEVANQCPSTVSFLKKFFDTRFYRVIVRNLKSGGKIHPHFDSYKNALGVSDKTSSANTKFLILSIDWPDNIIFNIGKYNLPIKTGEAWLLNYSLVHEVANNSNRDRYMLTITGDLDNSEKFRNSVEQSYQKNSKKLFLEKKNIN